jgi:tetratricopeptide (TPR) repeat protein
MKYLLTLSFLVFMVAGAFAQDKTAAELKNEGNEALRTKNYKGALELFEKSIAIWEEGVEMDTKMVYNTATSARKIKDHEKALKYYTMAKELGYKPDYCTYYIAKSLNSLNKEAEMEKVLVAGLKEYKTSKAAGPMKKMLVTYYLKEGATPYNEAGGILATAAKAEPKQYDGIIAKANAKFEEAKPFFEKVLEVDPNNASAKATLAEINDRLSGKKS